MLIYLTLNFILLKISRYATVYAHAHILADNVTLICQSASQRKSLVVLQLHWQRLPSEGAYNRIASFWKAPVDNSDSRIALVCHDQAAARKPTFRSNSTLDGVGSKFVW